MVVEVNGSPGCRLVLLGGRLSSFIVSGMWAGLESNVAIVWVIGGLSLIVFLGLVGFVFRVVFPCYVGCTLSAQLVLIRLI